MTLGTSTRLFEGPAPLTEFDLTDSVPTTKGVIIAHYTFRSSANVVFRNVVFCDMSDSGADPAGGAVRAVYGWRTTSRWLFLLTSVVGSAIIASMLVGLALTDAGPFTAVLIIVVVVGCLVVVGLVLWRVALTVELTGADLRWRAAVRRASVPIVAVRTVRPVPVLAVGGVHALTVDGQPAVWVLVSKGFAELLDDIGTTAGEVDVRLSAAVGRVDRIPGRNQYRRLS